MHRHLNQMFNATPFKHVLLRGFFSKSCIEGKRLDLTKTVINLHQIRIKRQEIGLEISGHRSYLII